MSDIDRAVDALAQAVEGDPSNAVLRLQLARLLLGSGHAERALDEAARVLALEPANIDALRTAAEASSEIGDEGRANGYRQLLEALGVGNPADPVPDQPQPEDINKEFADILQESFGPVPVGPAAPEVDAGSWEVEQPQITLADVAGMEEVKRRIQVSFLGPLRDPSIAQAYRKALRTGLLLYGPPGCGKTYIAKAIAGELGSRFISLGLSDVLNMWLGESERQLHEAFELARNSAPCVLFFDELDAIGAKRANLRMHAGRNVVVQLLQELDGVDAANQGLFVLAATNQPWDVDEALRRPGRFDRVMLVLPPDGPAREAIVRSRLEGRPTEDVDLRAVAKRTESFSGADLVHLVDTATELAMERSVTSGSISPISDDDFSGALGEVRPSTGPWFEVARNYAYYSNQSGVYDDLAAYLKSRRM